MHKLPVKEMDSDFFGILWTIFIFALGIGAPIIDKISKKKKAAGNPPRSTAQRRFTPPSAGTSIEIPDKKESFSPIKADEEDVVWPERNLSPTPPSSKEDSARDILARIFGEDFFNFEDEKKEPEVQPMPSSTSADDEGVCSLGTHEPRKEKPQPAPKPSPKVAATVTAPSETPRHKIVDDPRKLIVYAEIMKPKFDEF